MQNKNNWKLRMEIEIKVEFENSYIRGIIYWWDDVSQRGLLLCLLNLFSWWCIVEVGGSRTRWSLLLSLILLLKEIVLAEIQEGGELDFKIFFKN